MKRILVILTLLVAGVAQADTCATSLMPAFTAAQSTQLCKIFGSAVNHSLIPSADNTYDLGSSSLEWKDVFVDGTVTTDALDSGAALFSSTVRGTSATGLGWTIVSGANTACNTTCGISACVFGADTASGFAPVACAGATADVCICSGAAS